MPRHLDPHQKAELVEFLNEIANRAGYEHDAEWGRDSGVHYTGISKARSLSNGKTVDAYNLYRLIKAAARRIDEDAAGLALAAPPSQTDLRQAVAQLEAVVERLTGIPSHPPDVLGGGQV